MMMDRSAGKEHLLSRQRALIAALLISPAARALALPRITPAHFSRDTYRLTIHIIKDFDSSGKTVNPITVTKELRDRGELAAIGGVQAVAAYLDELDALVAGGLDGTSTDALVDEIVEAFEAERYQNILRSALGRTGNGTPTMELRADFEHDYAEIYGDTAKRRDSGNSTLPTLDAPVAVLRRLRDQGDPIPTGCKALDQRTRGGMRPGKALVIGGTAGAGKTALVVQATRAAAEAGCVVGCLFADEGREPAIIRLGQQFGFERDALEAVDHPAHETALAGLERDLVNLDIFFPDPDADCDMTIEGVVEALAQTYPDRCKVVVVDSIQTVRTRQTVREVPSLRERIMGNARLARALAVEHGLVMIYTSEVNRSWYRSRKEEDRASDLAAFAEARIEFSGDVLVAMRALEDDPDLVEVRIPKNRLGTRQPFLLRLDRERARFEEVDGTMVTPARDAALARKVDEAKAAVLRALDEHKELTRSQLWDLVQGNREAFQEALRDLKAGGIVVTQPQGRSVLYRRAEIPS